jgi:hypothetical protein
MNLALALAMLATHAPLPAHVRVVQHPCPQAQAVEVAGCADVARGIVYVAPALKRGGPWPWRFALAHELGHVWDYQHMADATRQRYTDMIGQAGADWQSGAAAAPLEVFAQPPPQEIFADAYAFCAMGPRYRRWDRTGHVYIGQFYFDTIPARAVAATCWLLHHPPVP